MHAGELKHTVEIQRLQKTVTNNITSTDYVPLKKVRAKVNNLYGKEKWEAAEYNADKTVKFTIRYSACPDLTVKDRLEFRGKLFNITHIDEVLYGKHFINITAVAVEEGESNG